MERNLETIPGLGKNGFRKGPIPSSYINAWDPQHSQPLAGAQEAYRNAQFVLENKKRAVPSLAEMTQALLDNPLTRVEQQLALLKENHKKDLQMLYAYQDRQVRRELNEQRKYLSCNEDLIFESTVDIWDSRAWESLFGRYPSFSLAREHRNQYEQLKHAYLVQLLPLTKQRDSLQNLRAIEKRRLERAFPQTIEEFQNKPKDLKVSAAKFFDAKPEEKERLLRQNHWTWEQVMPLQKIFNADKQWQTELRKWLLVASQGLVDPRKRLP